VAGVSVIVIVIAAIVAVLLYKLKTHNTVGINPDLSDIVEIPRNEQNETVLGGRLANQ
jgi:hypothetical protein